MVYRALALIWIAVPVYVITSGSLGTDIVNGSCIHWHAFRSEAMKEAVGSLLFLITDLIPLTVIVFCYSRIVYALKQKV